MKPIARPGSLAILLVGIAGGFARAGLPDKAWEPPLVVTVHGGVSVMALQPNWGTWSAVGEAGHSQGLLLRDGDWFATDELIIRYQQADGLDLALSVTDWSATIGDKIVTLEFDAHNDDPLGWLQQATDRQLADIRTLMVPEAVDGATLASLKRLAVINPSVDLAVDSGAALNQVLPLFRPRSFFGLSSDWEDAQWRLLAEQPQIELVWINAEAPGSLDVLTKLPKLRTLLLLEWDIDAAGPLPAGLPSLTTLLLFDVEGLTDLTPLGAAAAGLEELSIIGSSQFTDIAGIGQLTGLRTLFLSTDAVTNLTDLDGLTRLRWVGLPPKLPQDAFAAFVNAHPALVILDMGTDQTLKDLAPLGSLRHLQGLVLGSPFEKLDAVQKLTSLRFLGVSHKVWKEMPDQVAAVQRALPDALVVPVAPLCLGSGWIVLLLPVPFLAWLRRRHRSLRVRQPA
jgi:hypothetical protein